MRGVRLPDLFFQLLVCDSSQIWELIKAPHEHRKSPDTFVREVTLYQPFIGHNLETPMTVNPDNSRDRSVGRT